MSSLPASNLRRDTVGICTYLRSRFDFAIDSIVSSCMTVSTTWCYSDGKSCDLMVLSFSRNSHMLFIVLEVRSVILYPMLVRCPTTGRLSGLHVRNGCLDAIVELLQYGTALYAAASPTLAGAFCVCTSPGIRDSATCTRDERLAKSMQANRLLMGCTVL